MVYTFDGHSLDAQRRELRRGDDMVALEPQVFDLLLCLIRHRERVVTKDELLADVWRGRIVSESTLSSRIAALRQAVGDSGARQHLVRTIARRGFRFIGNVTEASAHDGTAALEPDAPRHARNVAAAALSTPASERRPLTVMACSMVGAAPLASRLDPEDLREVMAQYCQCVKTVLARWGGMITRYTADGVLASFGYPRAHEDDAERAVRAGLATVQAVGELRHRSVAGALQTRVGIATGLVVVGDRDAVDATPQHAVIGETPHLAARLLEAGAAGAVVISSGTRRLIGSLFEYRELSRSHPSGDAAWQVLREAALADRFEALRPARSPLIGRDEELELLLRRWAQASTGEGRVVLVWGEPGIGKSHLIASLQDALGAQRHACLRYFCSPHRAQTALHPVIAQLEHAAGFAPGDGDELKLDKLARLFARGSQSRAEEHDLALFAELLSIASAGRCPPLPLSPPRRKELLLERFVAHLASMAARDPVLLVLEDAHWLDPTTRELFDLVIDRVRDLPVLFVMSYRPEFTPSWLGQPHVTALTLSRLGRRQSSALVSRVTRGKELPSALLERMLTQTDGVPLFIEEVTQSVLESGVVREEDGAYVLAGPLPMLAVPPTLQASLIARLDRLDGTRVLAQTSAALGREFRYEVLKAVMALGDDEMQALLGQLVASGLVHQRGAAPHAGFVFKHALVQDAAYETLLKAQRVHIHRRIVDVFEHDFPATAERQPDVLAHHCREAGLAQKAIDYSIRAARMALERSAGAEAQAQVESAMRVLPTMPIGPDRQQLQGRLQVALAEALMMTKGFASPEVRATLSRARELLGEGEQPVEAMRALCGLFNYHLMRSESPQGLALVDSLPRREPDRAIAPIVAYLAGTAHLHLGHFGESKRHLETALSLYDEDACRAVAFVPGYHLRCFTLIWLGLSYLYLGSLEQADATIGAAVADARSRSHPFTLVSALLALARFRGHLQDLPAAIEATEEGLAIATEQRSPYHVSRANILRAVNVIDSGRAKEGIASMERALIEHRRTGANFQSSYNLSRLAEAYAQAGEFERASRLATEAVAEVARTGERWWEAEAKRSLGEILLMRGGEHGAEAQRCFEEALACARRQQAMLWELNAARSLSSCWLARGRHHEARELLAPVCGAFSEGCDSTVLKRARATLDRLA